jgi:cyclophilin family peptidyl-prolyl cis-trans isomerase
MAKAVRAIAVLVVLMVAAVGSLSCGSGGAAVQGGTTGAASSGASTATSASAGAGNSIVVLKTNKGDITIELDAAKAPVTVANFLAYVKSGQYDGTIFHRVMPGFMIQGGGFTPDMVQKPTQAPIKNEADNGLKNVRGSVAMARTQVVDSATSQFFINLVDNARLDFTAATAAGWGYAVFGKVTAGMETVDAIAAVPTTTKGANANVPQQPVIIESARVAK